MEIVALAVGAFNFNVAKVLLDNQFCNRQDTLTLLCFPIALIVSFSRLYLGVHYLSDVIAGMFIAIISSGFLHCVFF